MIYFQACIKIPYATHCMKAERKNTWQGNNFMILVRNRGRWGGGCSA